MQLRPRYPDWNTNINSYFSQIWQNTSRIEVFRVIRSGRVLLDCHGSWVYVSLHWVGPADSPSAPITWCDVIITERKCVFWHKTKVHRSCSLIGGINLLPVLVLSLSKVLFTSNAFYIDRIIVWCIWTGSGSLLVPFELGLFFFLLQKTSISGVYSSVLTNLLKT